MNQFRTALIGLTLVAVIGLALLRDSALVPDLDCVVEVARTFGHNQLVLKELLKKGRADEIWNGKSTLGGETRLLHFPHSSMLIYQALCGIALSGMCVSQKLLSANTIIDHAVHVGYQQLEGVSPLGTIAQHDSKLLEFVLGAKKNGDPLFEVSFSHCRAFYLCLNAGCWRGAAALVEHMPVGEFHCTYPRNAAVLSDVLTRTTDPELYRMLAALSHNDFLLQAVLPTLCRSGNTAGLSHLLDADVRFRIDVRFAADLCFHTALQHNHLPSLALLARHDEKRQAFLAAAAAPAIAAPVARGGGAA